MRFFIARHPQTEWNKNGAVQGHLDSPLTEIGVQTAHILGKKLQSKGITKIISSDLGRCQQTTDIINGYLNVPAVYTPALREQNFGIFNGKPKPTSSVSNDWSDPAYVLEGGESFLMMKKRAVNCIQSYLQKSLEAGETYMFVAHDGTVRALLSEVYNCETPDNRCKLAQGDIVECSTSGGLIVHIYTF